MSVKVIGQSDDSKKVTCRNCGAVLRYWPVDVQERVVRDYTGVSERECHIVCPKCSKRVYVDA